jgi:hypothetical protein
MERREHALWTSGASMSRAATQSTNESEGSKRAAIAARQSKVL